MPKFTLEKPVEEEKPIHFGTGIDAGYPFLTLDGLEHAFIDRYTGVLVLKHIPPIHQKKGIDYTASGYISIREG